MTAKQTPGHISVVNILHPLSVAKPFMRLDYRREFTIRLKRLKPIPKIVGVRTISSISVSVMFVFLF